MTECIFCKIISNEIPSVKVYEDGKVLAFLDIRPVNSGHVLLISKKHYANMLETPDDVLKELVAVSKKIAPAVLKAVNASAFNLTVNNGVEAGQAVAHTHFHIIPRLAGDGHRLWSGRDYIAGEMEEIGRRVREFVKESF